MSKKRGEKKTCPHCGERVTLVHQGNGTVAAFHEQPWCEEWSAFIKANGRGWAPDIVTDQEGNYVRDASPAEATN